jgi:glycerol-3-phosphate acyltransferase PlsY
MDLLLWSIVGYLFGSIPTGYLLGKLKGIDVRKVGSGNIGTANVYRVLGGGYALLTALGDILKGFLPVFLAPTYLLSVVAGMGTLTGAIFSIFLEFRGGKGFGALVGILLALLWKNGYWWFFLIALVVWLATVTFSGYTSLANIVTILGAVPLAALSGDPLFLSFLTFAALLVLYSHRENVRRLKEGTERSFQERVKDERW